MNKLLSMLSSLKNSVMTFDWERGVLTRMIEQCVGAEGKTMRLLDVGCGYGRNLDTTKNLCGTCIGIDINPEIVRTNKERGLECYLAGELPRNGMQFDIILMSHVIEHFAPEDLLEFMDGYLDLLRPGGHLIVATPLMSPYFYDDFDHIKPYQPTGMLLMYGQKNAQVQYHSRHELVLSDLRFRRSYYRASYRRSRYIKTAFSRVAVLLEFISALISFVFMGRLGRVDGWMGVFRKV